jgi:hypothetical protein
MISKIDIENSQMLDKTESPEKTETMTPTKEKIPTPIVQTIDDLPS